jgi:hypothetical protein
MEIQEEKLRLELELQQSQHRLASATEAADAASTDAAISRNAVLLLRNELHQARCHPSYPTVSRAAVVIPQDCCTSIRCCRRAIIPTLGGLT